MIFLLGSLVALTFAAVAPVSSDVCVTSGGTAIRFGISATDPDVADRLTFQVLTTDFAYGVTNFSSRTLVPGIQISASAPASNPGQFAFTNFTYTPTSGSPDHIARFTFRFVDSFGLASADHTARIVVSRLGLNCSVDELPVPVPNPEEEPIVPAELEPVTGCDFSSCDDCLGKSGCVYCEGEGEGEDDSGTCVRAFSIDTLRCVLAPENRIRTKADTCSINDAPKSPWWQLKKAFQSAFSRSGLDLRRKFLVVVSLVLNNLAKQSKNNAKAVDHAISVFVEILGQGSITEEDKAQLCQILLEAMGKFEVNIPTPIACRVEPAPAPHAADPQQAPQVTAGEAGRRKRAVSPNSYVVYLGSHAGKSAAVSAVFLFSAIALALGITVGI